MFVIIALSVKRLLNENKQKMIENLKNKTTKFDSQIRHNSYGIQKYLLSKGFIVSKSTKNKVDENKYKELIKNFCLSIEGFDNSKVKSIRSYESYIQNNFGIFTKYCKNYFENKNI